MDETPAQRKNRITRNYTAVVMNSTVQDHQFGAESRAAMSCELSTINNSLIPLKRVTDTPAKVFARLKAKVQQENSEEHREDVAMPRQLGRGGSLSTNMQQPPVDAATFEEQDTHVLTLSPPKSMSQNSDLGTPTMTSNLDKEGGYYPDLVYS